MPVLQKVQAMGQPDLGGEAGCLSALYIRQQHRLHGGAVRQAELEFYGAVLSLEASVDGGPQQGREESREALAFSSADRFVMSSKEMSPPGRAT